jgi:hypothetical protein
VRRREEIHLCRHLSFRRNFHALQFDVAVYDNRLQKTMINPVFVLIFTSLICE